MEYGLFKRLFFVVLILICTCMVSASAVLLETTVTGEVTKLDEAGNEIAVYVDEVWNGESWVMYSVTSINKQDLVGSVPEGDIFDYLSIGDVVQATFTGDETSTVIFVTVAKVELPDSSSRYLSDSWGDPSVLVSPFFNNFKISYETTADCNDCSGSVCTAESVNVSVSQGWEGQNYFQELTMMPEERHLFSSPEGCESELVVTFEEGQASVGSCNSMPVGGPQPVSDFAIHVVQKGTETEVTATPTASSTKTPVTFTPTETETPQSPGFALVGALFGISVAFFVRKLI
jgi:hypothetical protein